MKKRLFMETTMINPAKTVSEIQTILGSYGANAILINYEGGEVSAISFKISVNNQDVPFLLPCRWKFIFKALTGRDYENVKPENWQKSIPQAKRVAWRQILRWVQAQLALTETNMVSIQEVFLPYMQSRTGKTLYELVQNNNFKMLEGPK